MQDHQRRPRTTERRHHARVVTGGNVMLTTQGYVQRARLGNLSAGGLFVLTTVKPLDRLLHATLDLQIRLDSGITCRVNGRVVRIREEGLALAFEMSPVALLGVIEELMTVSVARSAP
jgi:PilZ domain-containing protein